MTRLWPILVLHVALTPEALGDDLALPVSEAISRGTRALLTSQSADGAWRSKTYGAFKDGSSLTPSILKAVAFGPTVEGSDVGRTRGATFLVRQVRPDGSIDEGPFGRLYPVYADAASAIALSQVPGPGSREAISAFVNDLRRRQLNSRLGWTPEDPAFGAWGYGVEPTQKRPGRTHVDADLSSTLFAVGTLRITGASTNDPAIRDALVFVERCQNFREGDANRGDGGFFLTPTDPARNKAGSSDQGRFQSYGSATADGLRALLRCGLPIDHPRVNAALIWLEQNFSATTVPGRFEPTSESEREATYYYYCWSVAHAFRSMGIRTFEARGRRIDWADELARELIRRQKADGTWSNRFSASKEDDPLVATPFALGALANRVGMAASAK